MNIGIIGVGRLGLCYALVLEQKGFNVIASSYKQDYIDQLKVRQTDSVEPGVADLVSQTQIDFTIDNHHVIANCDILYVMVATPSTDTGNYNISAVEQVVEDFLNHSGSVKGKILVVGSTVNPGNCEHLQKKLNARGVDIVYCPTFAAQGSVLRDITNPHSLLLGTEDTTVANKCFDVFVNVVGKDTPVYQVHPTTAEILKLGGNCRATVEISYFNMMGQILINSGRDKDLATASTYLNFVKALHRWSPGYGYGGPCYPRDNRAFVHYAKGLGMDFALGQVIDQFNNSHVDFLLDYFIKDNDKKMPYYFEYLSYKQGVNIFEESQQLTVCKRLLEFGHTVYVEPSVYLLAKIKDDLVLQYPNVHFKSLADLKNQGINIYNANKLIKD